MTASTVITTKEGVRVDVPPGVAGDLLHEAFRDFRGAYSTLALLCHMLASDYGGPSELPVSANRASRGSRPLVGPPDPQTHAITLDYFIEQALTTTRALADALTRAGLFQRGDVYDALIEQTDLGPLCDGGDRRRQYVAADTVVCHNNGLNITVANNAECDRQPTVLINTENLPAGHTYGAEDSVLDPDKCRCTEPDTEPDIPAGQCGLCGLPLAAAAPRGGMPKIAVYLGDAELYDDMGNGNAAAPIDATVFVVRPHDGSSDVAAFTREDDADTFAGTFNGEVGPVERVVVCNEWLARKMIAERQQCCPACDEPRPDLAPGSVCGECGHVEPDEQVESHDRGQT